MSDQFIGSYKILKKVGSGGMGQVYLAVHQDVPNLKVVLKVLGDPRMVERFRSEADKLALLDGHGNICQIKHFFNRDDDFVIAMEYIDGVTLDAMFSNDEPLPVEKAIPIIAAVLSTLGFAHERGISHRDIKPSNIMIDKNGNVKIIDFGIAKSDTDPNLTMAGSSCGTPAYMAPEQFNPTDKIDYVRADIYATATTLYTMVTGELPFEGDNPFALRDAKMFNEPIAPSRKNRNISKELDRIILKGLSKMPEDRYATTAEMIDDLKTLSGSQEIRQSVTPPEVRVGDETVSIKTPKPGPSRTRKKLPIVPIIGGAVVVITAAIVIIMLMGGEKGQSVPLPEIYAPKEGVTLRTNTPTFSWQDVFDGAGSFVLELDDNPSFESPSRSEAITRGRFTWEEPLDNGAYYWRVQPISENGQAGEFTEAYAFAIEISEATAPGTLSLNMSPSGTVYVNDELMAGNTSSWSNDLPAGEYIVRVENNKSTQKAFVDTVLLASAGTAEKSYRFTIPQPKPKQTTGSVVVGSRPAFGATVYIDDKEQADLTPFTYIVPAGTRVIRAEMDIDGSLVTRDTTLVVESGETHRVMFDFAN